MIRAALLMTLALSACQTALPEGQVYAPGIARGQVENQRIVGHRLMEAREFELALRAYSRVAYETGLTPDLMADMGTANLGLGRLGQAEELLRGAVKSPDASPETWNNLGVVLLELGETAEAVHILRKAFALDNGNSDTIKENLRKALAKLDDPFYDAVNESGPELIYRGTGNVLLVTGG